MNCLVGGDVLLNSNRLLIQHCKKLYDRAPHDTCAAARSHVLNGSLKTYHIVLLAATLYLSPKGLPVQQQEVRNAVFRLHRGIYFIARYRI